MDPAWSDEKAKLKREKSREAIVLALQGKWERAAELNQRILQIFPEDVETLNRLGKAFLELGHYSRAREAFQRASTVAPYNTISKKNLDRLAHLEEAGALPKQGKLVTPYLFIEESGKSGITVLERVAPRQVLAKMTAGDELAIGAREHGLIVENLQGEYLGQVEPKLGIRLLRLMKGGNRYDAAIISTNHQEISIIIWEAYRHPDLGSVCSFPTRSKEEYKVHWKDARLRYDIDSEREEDEESVPEWMEGYAESPEVSDGDEQPESISVGKPSQASPDDDEEE